jgi:sterol desaturase/sphingolipid hydroxylase (fatty acid hydroxylase superfamily)
MSIFVSLQKIFETFIISSLSAYFICKCINKPFINPIYSKEKVIEYMKEMAPSTIVILTESTLFHNYISSNVLLPTNAHTGLQSIHYCLLYSCFIELFYYVYHRGVHNKYLYALIHKKHHQNTIVYPFDTFYLGYIDDLSLTGCFQLPFLFIEITEFELFVVLYIYITMSYLSHSNYIYSHHYIHYTYLYCNFCILNPVFDMLFGTYKK